MQPPYPSPTPTWHNDTYQAINPVSENSEHEGKTVLVLGAGSGIGRATAHSFAASHVGHLHLAGRTKETLYETKALLPEGFPTTIHVCDATDEDNIVALAKAVGEWDILILCAASNQPPAPIASTLPKDYWSCYEGNVKSLILTAHAFISKGKAKKGASMVALTSGSMVLPPAYTPGTSAYQVSKLAQVKTIEYLAAENPGISFFAVHPGLVDTKIFRTVGVDPADLPMDTPELAADFLTWVTGSKGEFLNGRMVFANWDVEELEAMKEEIQGKGLMTFGMVGWPFMHAG